MTEYIRPAKVSYGDWVGTAAADKHITIGHRTIYEVVGLDPDEWWIVGLDFVTVDLATGHGFYVYAVHKTGSGITDWTALQDHGNAHESIPVTSFLVHDIAPAQLIAESFTDFHLQLRARGINHDFRVTEKSDLNYTEK